MAGGHGTCGDFVENPDLIQALELMYGTKKVVAAVCHGPIALAECKKPADGRPLVEGLKVTGFSQSEEEAVKLTNIVPWGIELRFKEQGAKYEKADEDWAPHVCMDGTLITGQNPASSEECAKAVITMLSI